MFHVRKVSDTDAISIRAFSKAFATFNARCPVFGALADPFHAGLAHDAVAKTLAASNGNFTNDRQNDHSSRALALRAGDVAAHSQHPRASATCATAASPLRRADGTRASTSTPLSTAAATSRGASTQWPGATRRMTTRRLSNSTIR